MSEDEIKQSVAYHEAAHSIVGCTHGDQIIDARIYKEGSEWQGKVRRKPHLEKGNSPTEEAERLLAGQVSEYKFLGRMCNFSDLVVIDDKKHDTTRALKIAKCERPLERVFGSL